MNKRKSKKFQPGLQFNSERKADEMHVSPAIANANVVCRLSCRTKSLFELKKQFDRRYKFVFSLGICTLSTYIRVRLFECLRCVESGQKIAFVNEVNDV